MAANREGLRWQRCCIATTAAEQRVDFPGIYTARYGEALRARQQRSARGRALRWAFPPCWRTGSRLSLLVQRNARERNTPLAACPFGVPSLRPCSGVGLRSPLGAGNPRGALSRRDPGASDFAQHATRGRHVNRATCSPCAKARYREWPADDSAQRARSSSLRTVAIVCIDIGARPARGARPRTVDVPPPSGVLSEGVTQWGARRQRRARIASPQGAFDPTPEWRVSEGIGCAVVWRVRHPSRGVSLCELSLHEQRKRRTEPPGRRRTLAERPPSPRGALLPSAQRPSIPRRVNA